MRYDDLEDGRDVRGRMVGSEADGKNEIGVGGGGKWIGVKAL